MRSKIIGLLFLELVFLFSPFLNAGDLSLRCGLLLENLSQNRNHDLEKEFHPLSDEKIGAESRDLISHLEKSLTDHSLSQPVHVLREGMAENHSDLNELLNSISKRYLGAGQLLEAPALTNAKNLLYGSRNVTIVLDELQKAISRGRRFLMLKSTHSNKIKDLARKAALCKKSLAQCQLDLPSISKQINSDLIFLNAVKMTFSDEMKILVAAKKITSHPGLLRILETELERLGMQKTLLQIKTEKLAETIDKISHVMSQADIFQTGSTHKTVMEAASQGFDLGFLIGENDVTLSPSRTDTDLDQQEQFKLKVARAIHSELSNDEIGDMILAEIEVMKFISLESLLFLLKAVKPFTGSIFIYAKSAPQQEIYKVRRVFDGSQNYKYYLKFVIPYMASKKLILFQGETLSAKTLSQMAKKMSLTSDGHLELYKKLETQLYSNGEFFALKSGCGLRKVALQNSGIASVRGVIK